MLAAQPISAQVEGVNVEDGSTITRELVTDKGGDREANMFAFAEEGLKLLKEVLTGTETVPPSAL